MQNFTKSQTRLAFIQYIFQSEFLKIDTNNIKKDFQDYFYNSNISVIGEKEFKLKFNKNFFNKLLDNFSTNFEKELIIKQINKYIDIKRKFEKWDLVLKSLIFALISEIEFTEQEKIKIVLNDYLNISKSLVSSKETKLINAVIQKYLDEKKDYKN